MSKPMRSVVMGSSKRNVARRRSLAVWNSAARLLHRFARDERGNIVITAALALPIAVGVVGMAVTYSTGNANRTSMQGALDAAVLAGAIADSDQITVAQKVFQNNLNSFATSQTAGIAATFEVKGLIVYGAASGNLKNAFGGLIGSSDAIPIGVKAAATKEAIPICVLGLNGLDNGAFDINGKPTFDADCAVQANSNSKSGMSQEGKSATVKAKKFGVSGGHKTETYVPPPSDGSEAIKDPYASIPFPPHAACAKGSKGLDIKDDTTLSPGTYCGGITITGSSPKVTLLPGIYVMVDGPFWTKGGAIVTGSEVMIAFTGKDSSFYAWGNSSLQLTSPKSGPYVNMQFMGDRDNADSKGTWVSIGGNDPGKGDSMAKVSIDGTAYFPNQNFWTFGNASLSVNSPSVAIVADKIWTQGNASVTVTNRNSRNLAVAPAPTTTYGAKLIK